MNQTAEEFLRERLLYDDNGNVFSKMNEVISFCKMFAKIKCKEQITKCFCEIEFTFNEFNEINGIDISSIDEISLPNL